MGASSRLRLVVLLEDLDFGGTQRYVTHFLKHLDRERFEPELWTLRGGSDFREDIKAAGIEVRDMSIAGQLWPGALYRLFRALKSQRPDLLYTLTVLPNIWGRLFAGLLRINVVSGYRNSDPNQHEWLLHRFSRRIIVNAAWLKQSIITRFKVPSERISVVANGVDCDHFRPQSAGKPSEPIVLCIARRVKQKDLPTLVEAFLLTLKHVPNARLRIVGNGPVRISPHPQIELLAAETDIRPYLASAWVFALSSVDEGSPNVVLEAMASGLPIAATDVGGLAELVADGRNGFLVPPRDPKALSKALSRLLGDDELRRTMSDAGRQRACEEFSIPGMVRQTEQILWEVSHPDAPQGPKARAEGFAI